mgnify:CR=1 FL=1
MDGLKSTYCVNYVEYTGDFKAGMEWLTHDCSIQGVFMGLRSGDPYSSNAEIFQPSSAGWPSFMRINPILRWTYHQGSICVGVLPCNIYVLYGDNNPFILLIIVWAFLRQCKVQYCVLYDQGYTSIGNIKNTVPNSALAVYVDEVATEGQSREISHYKPAYQLPDENLERSNRR